MVLQSMKDFTQLQPEMSQELNPYIRKLENQIEGSLSEKANRDVQQVIIDKKHESLKLPESVLKLGISGRRAKNIQGPPQSIDKHSESGELFEMWTYPKGSDVSHLYFRNNMLIRIEK